jgi:predicted restriction endonuclease
MEEARRRKRDRMLRPKVLEWWGPTCAACGMTLVAASSRTGLDRYECEVAHLEPVSDEAPDALNTMPLCRAHHWTYDRQLWAIHPGDFPAARPRDDASSSQSSCASRTISQTA